MAIFSKARALAAHGPVVCWLLLLVTPAGAQSDPNGSVAQAVGPSCGGGAVKDDGTAETGYGFVPSSVSGEYVQFFRRAELGGEYLERVCVCFLKTLGDTDIEFEVVLYESQGGRPAARPILRVPASAREVPTSVDAAHRFFDVDVFSPEKLDEEFFLGVHWNPKDERYLFVCADRGDDTQRTDVFFRENVRPRWSSVDESKDPIFAPHRALMVRAVGGDAPPPVPPTRDASSPPSLGADGAR